MRFIHSILIIILATNFCLAQETGIQSNKIPADHPEFGSYFKLGSLDVYAPFKAEPEKVAGAEEEFSVLTGYMYMPAENVEDSHIMYMINVRQYLDTLSNVETDEQAMLDMTKENMDQMIHHMQGKTIASRIVSFKGKSALHYEAILNMDVDEEVRIYSIHFLEEDSEIQLLVMMTADKEAAIAQRFFDSIWIMP